MILAQNHRLWEVATVPSGSRSGTHTLKQTVQWPRLNDVCVEPAVDVGRGAKTVVALRGATRLAPGRSEMRLSSRRPR